MSSGIKKYYLGIDLGTDSCGWAVTDQYFKLVKKGHKHLWGIRLFEEAKTAEDRRSFRTQRKRIQRRRFRISLLRELLQPEIDKVDPEFFHRLDNSSLFEWNGTGENRKVTKKDSLFADPTFHDKNFFAEYPTAYHLRKALIEEDRKFDIREIYLALHHIVKYRGNFLDENGGTAANATPDEIKAFFGKIDEAITAIAEKHESDDNDEENQDEGAASLFACDDSKAIKVQQAFLDKDIRGISATKEKLVDILGVSDKRLQAIIALIAGGKADTSNVLGDQSFKDDPDIAKLDFSKYDEKIEPNLDKLDEDQRGLILAAKAIYDARELAAIIGQEKYISFAMVHRYDEHKQQLKKFKGIVKTYYPHEIYKAVFGPLAADTANYSGYIGSTDVRAPDIKNDKEKKDFYARVKRGKHFKGKHFTREEFYAFVKKTLDLDSKIKTLADSSGSTPDIGKELSDLRWLADLIEKQDFLLRQNSGENGVIKHQLHEAEMEKILDNQAKYYPFLKQKDANGLSVEDKVRSILTFKIPYYIGPLDNNPNNHNSWAHTTSSWANKKAGERITPWNWKHFVDEGEAAEKFIDRMLNRCTYLDGENTLPANSLLYTEFQVLNEINKLKIVDKDGNGRFFSQKEKDSLLARYKLKGHLGVRELVQWARDTTGDNSVHIRSAKGDKDLDAAYLQANMKSWVDFTGILGKIDHENYDTIEKIIRDLTIFEDRKILKKRLGSYATLNLSDGQIDRISNLGYQGWGKLSEKLLNGIHRIDVKTGEVFTDSPTIIETMRMVKKDQEGKDESENFMEVLNNPDYGYLKAVESDNFALADQENGYQGYRKYVEDSYGSPMMKRAVIQSMGVIREAENILGHPIDCFFFEATRQKDDNKRGQNGNDWARSNQIQNMYKAAKRLAKASPYLSFVGSKNKEGKTNLEWLRDKANQSVLRSKKVFLYFLQMGRDVYTGKAIDFEDVLAGNNNVYDIDHIIPQSMIKDDSIENTVLVSRQKNESEKKDIYPIPIGVITPEGRNVIEFLHHTGLMSNEKYHRLTRPEGNKLTDDELSGFINRQLVSTAQSVKALRDVLETDSREKLLASHKGLPDYEDYAREGYRKDMPQVLFPKAVNTSEFRNKFSIYKCREVNDFHHAHDAYLNIVVGELFYSRFGSWVNREKISELKEKHYPLKVNEIFNSRIYRGSECIWNPGEKGTITKIKKELENRDILFTRRLAEQDGKLFDATIYSPKGVTDFSACACLKNTQKDIRLGTLVDEEKYGYYNKPSAAYYCLVESESKKGKPLYSIEPVPTLYKDSLFESKESSAKYFAGKGLLNPHVIIPKLLVNTLIEQADPQDSSCRRISRFMITGKTGSQYLITNATQAYFPEDLVYYCKLIAKYNASNKKEGKDGVSTHKMSLSEDGRTLIVAKRHSEDGSERNDALTKEMNLKLYDYITNQIRKPIYWKFSSFATFADGFAEHRDSFENEDIKTEIYDLTNMLALTQCKHNAGCDLSDLGGSSKSGALYFAKNISESTKILSQSITGYYEKTLFALDDQGNRVI